MFANKKGQDVSITVIIIAAIALLVLVFVAVIFLTKAGFFNKEENSCENKGGVCRIYDDTEALKGCSEGETKLNWKCYDDSGKADSDKVCCVSV